MFLPSHRKRTVKKPKFLTYMMIISGIIALSISTAALSSSEKSSTETKSQHPHHANQARHSHQAHQAKQSHHSSRREIASLRAPNLFKGTQPGIAADPTSPSSSETRYFLLHPQTLEEERYLGYSEHEDLPPNFQHAPEQLIARPNIAPTVKQDPYYVPPALLLFRF